MTVTPEIGKWYQRRDGEVVGPCDRNDNPKYPFWVGNFSYTTDGHVFSDINKYSLDLICEVPAPEAPTPTLSDCLRNPDVRALVEALAEALYGLSWAKAQIASADAAQQMPPRKHPPIDRARISVGAALATIETQAQDGPKGETK